MRAGRRASTPGLFPHPRGILLLDNGFKEDPEWQPQLKRYDADRAPPRRGVSLAKGPVALIGAASLALGVLGFIFASGDFTIAAPSGTVTARRSSIRARLDLGGCSPPPACCSCSARRSTGERSRWRSSSASCSVVGALISLSDG